MEKKDKVNWLKRLEELIGQSTHHTMEIVLKMESLILKGLDDVVPLDSWIEAISEPSIPLSTFRRAVPATPASPVTKAPSTLRGASSMHRRSSARMLKPTAKFSLSVQKQAVSIWTKLVFSSW